MNEADKQNLLHRSAVCLRSLKHHHESLQHNRDEVRRAEVIDADLEEKLELLHAEVIQMEEAFLISVDDAFKVNGK